MGPLICGSVRRGRGGDRIGSDVVKVEGAESGHPRSPDLRNDTGTAISPISGQQNKATHKQSNTVDESELTLDLPRRGSCRGTSLVVNGVVVGPFKEEEEGTGIASDAVKVKGAESGHPRSPDLRNDTGTAISPISGQQNKVTHTIRMFILQTPQNSHPFVWRVCFNTCLLVRIPGLFCVRGMLKIFVGKSCLICQLYWCFHLSVCNKNLSKRPAKLSTASQKRPVKR